MAAAIQSLKKLMYDNIYQFVEDINANFAIIQNSPLYKGIPGDEGDPGKTGLTGERGSHFYFVKLDNFLKQYPKEIVNGSSINLAWINTQLQSLVTTKQLLTALNVYDGKFVHNDVIVLTDSKMIEYDLVTNLFIDTGIAFYQQGSLVTSIEQRIEEYVKKYVDNNPIINSLRNIFIDYATYAQVTAQTSNTYITNKEANSSIYVPSLGAGTVTGSPVNTHKYFGYNSNQLESGKAATTVFGSIVDYVSILDNTISVIRDTPRNATVAPNKNNIPTIVLLQDTPNNGLMIGYKGTQLVNGNWTGNVANFASIFKDDKGNLHIKSDQGDNDTFFSDLILSSTYLYFAKQVHFGDNLTVNKDLRLDGNFDSKWIRTAESIKTKYISNSNNKHKVIEVGKLDHLASYSFEPKYISDTIYRNISAQIELPAFSHTDKRVVLTVEDKDDLLSKDYFIEENPFNDTISDNNLAAIKWLPSELSSKHIITSNYLKSIIDKINAIQAYVTENYWLRTEWMVTKRGDATYNCIPLLNVATLTVNRDSIFGAQPNRYFTSNIANKTLTIGFDNDNAKLLIRGKNIINIDFYRNFINEYSSANIITTANDGTLTKEYGMFQKFDNFGTNSDTDNIYYYLTAEQWVVEEGKKIIPTLAHLSLLSRDLKAKLTKSDNETWHKKDFTSNANPETGEDSTNPLLPGNIPNLFVKNLLASRELKIGNINGILIAGVAESVFQSKTSIQLSSNKINISGIINVKDLAPENFVTVDSDKNLVTINTKFEGIDINSIPNNLTEYLPTIANSNNKILTADDFLWLNKRINKVASLLDGNYWKKSEYYPENNKPLIPKLFLSDELKVAGKVYLGPTDNFAILFDGIKTSIGKSGDKEILYFRSGQITFTNKKFFGKVIVTGDDGTVRDDITLCTDTSDTENYDNLVPESITDTTKYNAKAGQRKTQDEHKVITGKQWKWLHTFIDDVKRRFINTFNRKETIDYVYDHMPVGSIIMWTEASYQALKQSLEAKGASEDLYMVNKVPKGWVICDGRPIPKINSLTSAVINTPNLVDKFVRGVGSTTEASSEDGNDFITIERKHLPDLTHAHTCDDIINEHSHTTSSNKSTNDFFTGQVWSNKNLKVHSSPNLTDISYSNIKNGNEYNLVTGDKFAIGNFEIPMMYKSYPGTNYFGPMNFRHKKDDTDGNWRRYDFDCSNAAYICISSNLTTIFENYAAKVSINTAKVLISHTIDDFNIGTGGNSDIKNQEQIRIVPKHYKVVYIMKYDTRHDTTDGAKDSRYELV